MTQSQHLWVHGGTRRARAERAAALTGLPPLVPAIDAHRRLRGPYTAAGTLLRAIVPDALAAEPAQPGRYDIEILAAAPELRAMMPMARETLTSLAAVRERTRFYGADRTAQLAHGLTEFLHGYLSRHGQPCSVLLDNVDQADHTDLELLAILLRRTDPALLSLVICSGSEVLPEPLLVAVRSYASEHELAPDPDVHDQIEHDQRGQASAAERAARYVQSECLSEDPSLRAGYAELSPEARARLHDERAAELAERGELSLQLGAVPYHLERGSDPRGAGLEAFRIAIDHCSLMGFYHATAELTARARPLVDWDQPKLCHLVTARMALSLIMTGRGDEAEPLYDEARLNSTDPEQHMMAAYSTSMLYTRHNDAERRDHSKAKAWINQAIAFATTYPDPKLRAFHTVFMQNGLALIEMHLGNQAEALRLVEAGTARLDAELDPGEHLLHRSVLVHNRGQVRAGLGRLEAAIADFTEAIEQDPNYAQYHFDRAGLLHRLGRDDESIADYEAAMRLSPPLAEAYYNRGDIRAGLGELAGALADFDYTLELDPSFLGAYIYRAGLRADLGELAAARSDVQAGLALEADNPHLFSIRGQLDAAEGDLAAADEAYDRALAIDPSLQAAWAGRASVAFERGDLTGAVTDLERALALGDSAALRYNRAAAYMAAERWDEALADLNRAVELDPADADTIAERERCLQHQAMVRA